MRRAIPAWGTRQGCRHHTSGVSSPELLSAAEVVCTRSGTSKPSRPAATAATRAPDGSADLADADQGARGIAEGAIANAIWLLGRLLDDLGAATLHPLQAS